MGKKVALVLSSGGARGVAHVGVIKELLDNGYEISAISGSSMGAVVGAVYVKGQLDAYEKWLCDLDRLGVFKLLDFTLSIQGFVRGEKVFREMRRFIDDCNIEDLEIPFSAVACDLINRREVVFNQGSLYDALRASAAVPSVLTPSIINNAEIVDGGVLNPIPIRYVKRTPNDLLVISDVNAPIPYEMPRAFDKPDKQNFYSKKLNEFLNQWNALFPKNKAPKKRLSYFEVIAKSVDLMQDKIAEAIIKESKPDVLIQISRDAASTFEFYRAEELIEAGRIATKKTLSFALPSTE